MFKREKVGEDILFEMDENLRRNAFVESTRKVNQRVEAMELLTKAAMKFESVGRTKEAEAVTRIIEHVAKPKPKMSPENQVKNLEETGTQWPKEAFNADPEEEEEKLFQEYMNMGLDEEIRVEEDEDKVKEAGDLNNHELAALKRLWG